METVWGAWVRLWCLYELRTVVRLTTALTVVHGPATANHTAAATTAQIAANGQKKERRIVSWQDAAAHASIPATPLALSDRAIQPEKVRWNTAIGCRVTQRGNGFHFCHKAAANLTAAY